jgi:hypothetical protein
MTSTSRSVRSTPRDVTIDPYAGEVTGIVGATAPRRPRARAFGAHPADSGEIRGRLTEHH